MIEQDPHVRALLAAYEASAKACCAPVFWRGEDRQLRNGTMTFLRTSSRVLGITNGHVADGIVNCKDEPGKSCQIGGAELDPARLIARHPTKDLATFSLSDVFLAPVGENHHAATVTGWPPEPLSEGEVVLYGGYPGIFREERQGEYDFGFAWVASKVETASDQHAGMVLLNFVGEFAANAAGVRSFTIRMNGVLPLASDLRNAVSGSNATRFTITTTYECTVGLYFEVLAFQNSGGALNVSSALNYSPEFSMTRLGP